MSEYNDKELFEAIDFVSASIYTGRPSKEDCKSLKADLEQFMVEISSHLHQYKLEEVTSKPPPEFNTCRHCEYFGSKDMCPKYNNVIGLSKICEKFIWDEIPF